MSITLSTYDSGTKEATWNCPIEGTQVLALDGLDFETAHKISEAIQDVSRVAWRVGRLRLQGEIETAMDRMTR